MSHNNEPCLISESVGRLNKKDWDSQVEEEEQFGQELGAPIALVERIERTGHALTADDLAGLLSVSRITVFKHAKAGRIPSFRIGTSVRFCPKAVANWLRSQ